MAGFCNSMPGLRTPKFAKCEASSPKVSRHYREYSRFAETDSGDRFDHDCGPTMALGRGQFSGPQTGRNWEFVTSTAARGAQARFGGSRADD
jgi:hypothetical protein